MPEYSVVIPTYKGFNRLPIVLDSLCRQSVPKEKLEVVVVDDGSPGFSQNDADFLCRFYAELNLRILRIPENKGPAVARNFGVANSLGKVIFFTDDDCEVPALWMERILNVYHAHPDVVGVGGWYAPPMNVVRKNIYHQFMYLYYHYVFQRLLNCEGKNNLFPPLAFPAANGGNLSVKKWVVEKAGGFDERFPTPGSEDIEFSWRICDLGFSMYYLPQWVIDRKILTFRRFLRLTINRATGLDVFLQLRKERHNEPIPVNWFSRFKGFVNFYKQFGYYHLNQIPSRSVIFLAAFYYFVMYAEVCRSTRSMRRRD